jgi:uncharacterized protein (DUF433 family)
MPFGDTERNMMSDIGNLISQTPDICGGRARIAGTGVSVRRIVLWDREGLTPEEIINQIPHLTLAQVYAALAYYHANRDQLDVEIAAEDVDSGRLEEEFRRARGEL